MEKIIKGFGKSDLRTGDIIEYRQGEYRMIMLNTDFGDILVNHIDEGYTKFEYYGEDLTNQSACDNKLDIIKVYRPSVVCYTGTFELELCDLIYEREPWIKISFSEVPELLSKGKEVKVTYGGEFYKHFYKDGLKDENGEYMTLGEMINGIWYKEVK